MAPGKEFVWHKFLISPYSENMGDFWIIPLHAQGIQVLQEGI
jgi:hypothetical protein